MSKADNKEPTATVYKGGETPEVMRLSKKRQKGCQEYSLCLTNISVVFFWRCWFWPRLDTQPCRDTPRTEAHLTPTTGSKSMWLLGKHSAMQRKVTWDNERRREDWGRIPCGRELGEGRAYRRSKAPGAECTWDKDHRIKEEALGRSTRVHLLSKDPKANLQP